MVLIIHSNMGGFSGIGMMFACKKTNTELAFLIMLPTILENMAFRFPSNFYYNFTTKIFRKSVYGTVGFHFD